MARIVIEQTECALRRVIAETCHNEIAYNQEIRIDGTLCLTVDDSQVAVLNLKDFIVKESPAEKVNCKVCGFNPSDAILARYHHFKDFTEYEVSRLREPTAPAKSNIQMSLKTKSSPIIVSLDTPAKRRRLVQPKVSDPITAVETHSPVSWTGVEYQDHNYQYDKDKSTGGTGDNIVENDDDVSDACDTDFVGEQETIVKEEIFDNHPILEAVKSGEKVDVEEIFKLHRVKVPVAPLLPIRPSHAIDPKPVKGPTKAESYDKDLGKYVCKHCSKAYSDIKCLYRHDKLHHRGVRYPCSQCGKELSSSKARDVHEAVVHRNEYEFHCHICGKGIITKEALAVHLDKHLDQCRYQCDYCGKTFYSKGNWKDHSEVCNPNAEKRYECEHCDERFASRRHWTRHNARIHNIIANANGNKKLSKENKNMSNSKFVCIFCTKHCKNADSLAVHVNTEHMPEFSFNSLI